MAQKPKSIVSEKSKSNYAPSLRKDPVIIANESILKEPSQKKSEASKKNVRDETLE